ncbi:hypothetical protein QAD02_020087 [Eretmocerus hayati]|uniref:Uncharacterized protein n=1 Tax=Eretmocerus hayati TaxID=131215 RepID=A0ACC2PL39_9HYME|nr:hypothetical protein QAD02_020087 [Eretmocerus hayati]
MQCSSRSENNSDGEINAEIDRILEEDRRERLSRKRKYSEIESCGEPECDVSSCAGNRTRLNSHTPQFIAVKQSKRFSLYVMEAMRVIQRQNKQASGCASLCDIVNFVTENFTNDGDIEAQVRTALRQLCLQGFVKDEKGDEYRLIGPKACQVIKASKANPGCGQSKTQNNRQCKTGAQSCRTITPQSQDSSDIDLSIPSSVKGDICRQKGGRDSDSGCRNDSLSISTEDISVERSRNPQNKCSTPMRPR